MPGVRGLTIIVTTDDTQRVRAALSLACAHAALGGRARIYCHEDAVHLLVPGEDNEDHARVALGLPTRAQLLAEAYGSGVTLIACQSGLAATGTQFEMLAPGCEAGGMVSLLSSMGEDRLVSF